VNNADIHNRVKAAMSSLIYKKGYAAPADVLMELGALSKEDYENWRSGRVPYLEKVCQINLSKLSTIMREMRAYAREHNLRSRGPTIVSGERVALSGSVSRKAAMITLSAATPPIL